jgi:hypothetical protein
MLMKTMGPGGWGRLLSLITTYSPRKVHRMKICPKSAGKSGKWKRCFLVETWEWCKKSEKEQLRSKKDKGREGGRKEGGKEGGRKEGGREEGKREGGRRKRWKWTRKWIYLGSSGSAKI